MHEALSQHPGNGDDIKAETHLPHGRRGYAVLRTGIMTQYRQSLILVIGSIASLAFVACSSDSDTGVGGGGGSQSKAGSGGETSDAGDGSLGESGVGGLSAGGEAGTGDGGAGDETGGTHTGGASTGGASTGGGGMGGGGGASPVSAGGPGNGGATVGGSSSGGTGGAAVMASSCSNLAPKSACTKTAMGHTTCEEATGSSYTAAVQATCAMQSGTLSTVCTKTALYGRCLLNCGATDETIIYYYDAANGDAGKDTCLHYSNVWDGP